MQEITIGLVQISEFHEESMYLPYTIGVLQAYAQTYAPPQLNLNFLDLTFSKKAVESIVQELLEADIVGLSLYVWNCQRSLMIAQLLKLQKPEILIIVGGPSVPDQAQEFLENHPYVDLCCHGEGEQTFLDILMAFPTQNWSSLNGVSYFDEKNHWVNRPKRARNKDLDSIPSPYLTGVFAPLLSKYSKINWGGLWETNRGCPFSCTFCDWGSATRSKVYQFKMQRLQSEIKWFASNKINMIYCCDANFGIFKRDVDIVNYLCHIKKMTGYPREFYIQSSKNTTQRIIDIHQTLHQANIHSSATIAVQSMDQATLKAIERDNISLQAFLDIQKQLTKKKIDSYSDIILGLPGETYESFIAGIDRIIGLGQHDCIKFNMATILPNAPMAQENYRDEYELKTVHIPFEKNHLWNSNAIPEFKEIIISTKSMPATQWIKARVYSWFVYFSYFRLKILQIPFLILNHLFKIPFSELFHYFIQVNHHEFPVVGGVIHQFESWALELQSGNGSEQLSSQEVDFINPPTPVLYSHEDLTLIQLLALNRYEAFYLEAFQILKDYLKDNDYDCPEQLLKQCVQLNQMISKISFQGEAMVSNLKYSTNQMHISLEYNIFELYLSLLIGQSVPLNHQRTTCSKTWEGAPYELAIAR